MAKKKSVPSITAPTMESSAAQAKRDEEYQVKDDADKIKRYAELRGDKGRHKKAVNHIRTENQVALDLDGGLGEDDSDVDQPRILARSGRKRSTRRLGRA